MCVHRLPEVPARLFGGFGRALVPGRSVGRSDGRSSNSRPSPGRELTTTAATTTTDDDGDNADSDGDGGYDGGEEHERTTPADVVKHKL